MPFLIQIVISLVIVGLLLWILDQVPIDPTIKRIIRVVVIVCVCLWLVTMLLPFAGSFSYPNYRR